MGWVWNISSSLDGKGKECNHTHSTPSPSQHRPHTDHTQTTHSTHSTQDVVVVDVVAKYLGQVVAGAGVDEHLLL